MGGESLLDKSLIFTILLFGPGLRVSRSRPARRFRWLTARRRDLCRGASSIPRDRVQNLQEKPRPITDPICATSRAGPSRSSRAVEDCCSVGGIACERRESWPLSRVMRSMLNEPALSLHAPDLKTCSPSVFSCQHQSPRNSSGIEPRIVWASASCHCATTNAAAAINLFIAFPHICQGGSLYSRRQSVPVPNSVEREFSHHQLVQIS